MYVDKENFTKQAMNFGSNHPFNYSVIDNFFDLETAQKLGEEFLEYDSTDWHVYKNSIENKKTLNNWNLFPSLTYTVFRYLCSDEFTNFIADLIGTKLYSDVGLHGGGWHIHSDGGNLNPHLDYSIHPKLKLQRKLNLIVYLSENMTEGMGGEFGMWDNNNNEPGDLIRSVCPLFNRAVIFDTTQNSWHGMVSPVLCPPHIYRQSMAVYYLCDTTSDAKSHQRALFAPREKQKADKDVEELIKKRNDLHGSISVYQDD